MSTKPKASPERRAAAVVFVFEASDPRGRYDALGLMAGDRGGLSYGLVQFALGAGSLARLIADYCDRSASASLEARVLQGFLPRLRERDQTLNDSPLLHAALRSAADDPAMRDAQWGLFEADYLRPAVSAALDLNITTALGWTAVLDSMVQGSWARVRDLTIARHGSPSRVQQYGWCRHYLQERRRWLRDHRLRYLRQTVYRPATLLRLADLELWDLFPPIVVRGVEITDLLLSSSPPGVYDGPTPGSRVLHFAEPLMRGRDVRYLQFLATTRGQPLTADGIYGPSTEHAVRELQDAFALPRTGAVSAELWDRLLAEPADLRTLVRE